MGDPNDANQTPETLPAYQTPKPCPECGGSRILCQTWEEGVLIPGTNMRMNTVPWVAHVCTVCGYTSLYVTDPQRLVAGPPKKRSWW